MTTLVTLSLEVPAVSRSGSTAYPPHKPRVWKLAEAKAKFSEVVRLAAEGQPQRVTVHGRDAVVVVAATDFERFRARGQSASLHELLSQSPLNRLEFEAEGVKSPVRGVEF